MVLIRFPIEEVQKRIIEEELQIFVTLDEIDCSYILEGIISG